MTGRFLAAFVIGVIIILLLASCATTTPPQSQVITQIKEVPVNVPVLIPCVYQDEVPKVPGTWMSETQSPEKRRLAVLADLKQAEDYILRADSLLRGCAKPRTEVPK